MLYVVIGLTGTGKSSVAKILAQKNDAVVLNADEFRQALFNIDSSKKDQVFPEEWRDIPYKAIFLTALFLIKRAVNVVIDAGLYSNKLVSEARSIAKNSKVIQVICPEEITKARLIERCKKSKKYSAGPKVHDLMKGLTEKIADVDYTIDTSSDWATQLKEMV